MSTPAIGALRQTPRLPAAMLATCVPCEPSTHLRLRLDVGRRQAEPRAPRQSRRSGPSPPELGAVLNCLSSALRGRAATAARRPPGPRCARSASCPLRRESRVGEVEPLHVDDADEHVRAVSVLAAALPKRRSVTGARTPGAARRRPVTAPSALRPSPRTPRPAFGDAPESRSSGACTWTIWPFRAVNAAARWTAPPPSRLAGRRRRWRARRA